MGFSVFMFKWLGAFRRILYFRVQTGTKPNLFNGGLVIYVYGHQNKPRGLVVYV